MNSTVALLFAVILTATISCKTPNQSTSSILDHDSDNARIDRTWLAEKQVYFGRLAVDVDGRWTRDLERLVPQGRVDFRAVRDFSQLVDQNRDKVNDMLVELRLLKQGFSRGDDIWVSLSLVEQTEQRIRDDVLLALSTHIPGYLSQLEGWAGRPGNPSTVITGLRRELHFLHRSVEDTNGLLAHWLEGGSAPGGMQFVEFTYQGLIFEMQTTEVTRGQWFALKGSYPDGGGSCIPTVAEDDHPVSCVSWHEATAFADLMTQQDDGYVYRLPTEEEWSFAAGDMSGERYGWCSSNSDGKTHPVGGLDDHDGLFDMVGNVMEWTATSLGSGRVARGGSWNFPTQNCRSAIRGNWRPDDRYSYVGFRLLRTRP